MKTKKKLFFCPFVKKIRAQCFIALASSFTIERYERKELSAVVVTSVHQKALQDHAVQRTHKEALAVNELLGRVRNDIGPVPTFDRRAVNVLFLSHQKNVSLKKKIKILTENRFSLILAARRECLIWS